MTHQFRSRQRGLSFLGLLVVGGLLAVTGVIGAQIVPTAIEYQAILKAANKAREGNSVAEVRSIFDKASAIDNISSISGKDIDVTKEGDKIVVSFAYQREIHLAGPGYLTLKYSGRSK
ncbi:MAG: DUF4845 domain-containing protein [Rhodoferax sp.]|jgi:hypothetical protein|uniref:DUF4845 domain-containing protein n=1 Tax=Rhodoferax sp. TaxID=50421 RepID=UPI0017E3BE0D|nr:DUF4845 domain-containing protein [Rhodoferax sp.]NMM13380.1 DUF4845 domain-containing protein [Rhodoferax sp.]NMM20752.1 DUF4845 domain-containing protein [Rhodoferax sp.]